MDDAQSRLRAAIEAEVDTAVPPAVEAFAEAIRNRHPRGAAAVLFYGSCLWRQTVEDESAVLDFYLLVDRYRDAYDGWLMAAANRLLPPNVFYLELPWKGLRLRAKYAIVTVDHFRYGTSRHSLQAALWARFAQPARLVYARDPAARAAVVSCLSQAVTTLVGASAPLLGDRFTAAELWTGAFRNTYRAELRTERSDRAQVVYAARHERFDRLTPAALAAAGLAYTWSDREQAFVGHRAMAPARLRARCAWAMRRVWGKSLNVLRLVKALFTFEGGVDYMVWKIERHTSVRPELSPWQRRHPLLAAPGVLWRLYRQGVIR